MSIKTWKERREGTAHSMEGAMLLEIAELRAELDKLKKQEPVAHVEIEHMVGVRFHANCEYGCNLKDGDQLYLAAGAQPQAELTDDDIDAVGVDFRGNYQDLRDFARAVLAAQKGKQ